MLKGIKNNVFLYFKIIFSLAFPFIFFIFFATIILWTVKIFSGNISQSFEEAVKYALHPVGIALEALSGLFIAINTNTVSFSKKIHEEVRGELSKIIGGAKIVLHIDIEEFSATHIMVIQDILKTLNHEVTDIYALDCSQPAQWWTNSMLGYLAVQAKWARSSPSKRVHRFFVLEKGELGSLPARKIIQFHALLGFETYLMTKNIYDEMFALFCKGCNKKIAKKEFFVWSNAEHNAYAQISMPKKFIYRNICGYQSFWSTDTPYNCRLTYIHDDLRTFLSESGGQKVDLTNHEKFPIMFEIISSKPEHKILANNHREFSNFLIDHSFACTYSDQILKLFGQDGKKVVHITTDSNLNIDSIPPILDEYMKIESA